VNPTPEAPASGTPGTVAGRRSNVAGRLSAMMFLQFFIWGAWYTTIAVYMTQEGMEALTHWPYTVNPVAAIVAPFFLGLVADRYFATEKVLGVLHLLGGAVMFLVPQASGVPTLFILLLLLYNLCYMPTLGLANSLVFHNIESQEKQFPLIRVFGTIGWIAAGLFISLGLGALVAVVPERTALPLYTAAAASVVLGIYSFTLPHTPPSAAGQRVSLRSILGLDALARLGDRQFYVFIAASLLLCIPLAAYYNFTQVFLNDAGVTRIAATQTLGQMSEVIFMLLMPFFFIRLGVKRMLMIGMAAWVLRYVLFALAAPAAVFWLIVGGILLHGICYDFFFVTGQIYVDKKSTPAVRGQAQGFLVLVTYGIGMLIGAQVAGNVFNRFLGAEPALTLDQWSQFWLLPAGFAAAVLIFFWALFRPEPRAAPTEPPMEGGAPAFDPSQPNRGEPI
jgi:nucleoside transporter